MKLKDMQIDELELLSYVDIAYMIIKENNKAYNTPDLFKKICELTNLSSSDFESKIGDFYTSTNMDKRFVLIGTEWDIVDHHSVNVEIDDDVEEILDEEEEIIEEVKEEDLEDDIDEDLDDDDIEDDELEELSIISDEELEEE